MVETSTEPNTEEQPVIQFRINRLLFEILREYGKGFDRSPHQEAKHILQEAMWKKQMFPKKDMPTIMGELLYGVIKYEQAKKNNQNEKENI